MVAGRAHGTDRDREDQRLLREQPPQRVLRWVEALTGGTVTAVEVMPGGISAAIHRITVNGPGERSATLVLRRYVRRVEPGEPAPVRREASALAVVCRSALPAPELVGADPAADHADVPALVTTFLPGRPRWDGSPRHRWVAQLAETAAAIHQTAINATDDLPGYRPYQQRSYEPPGWAHRRDVWERAVELFHGPIPKARVFLHRDFHPGNLLWRNRRLSGIVDWEHASIGPPDVDIGHCRMNFMYDVPELAEALADAWRHVTGEPFDPWADIAAIVGTLDGLRRQPPGGRAQHAIEDALGTAVASLTA